MQSANRVNLIAQHIANKSPDLVIYRSKDNLLTITLNRSKALNSLNLAMVRDIESNLEYINKHQIVWFQGAGGRSLCAGGDVKVLFEQGATVQDRLTFFREQFVLDYRISQMKTVQISCWDGIVMGGGVGLTVFAPFVIATQKTLFAMPQAKLGFFTDVGTNYILSRLRNNIGLYLGMTGARLKGQEVFIAGLANFYIPSEKLQSVYQQIQAKSKLWQKDKIKAEVCKVLLKYHNAPKTQILENEDKINQLFSLSSGRQIFEIASLKTDPFSVNIVKLLKQQCPVSVQLIYRLIKNAKKLTIRECFIIDYQILEHMAANQDFCQGVRCVLIEKGAMPKWSFASLLDVKSSVIDNFFVPVNNSKALPI